MAKALRWLFADRTTGQLVVAQWPNLQLWTFLLAWAASWLARPIPSLTLALRVVAGASLGLWALDELVRGANPWRRGLGAGVVAYNLFLYL